jgi:hypothetical protein
VIAQGAYAVEPWGLRETYLDPALLAQSESLFALATGTAPSASHPASRRPCPGSRSMSSSADGGYMSR